MGPKKIAIIEVAIVVIVIAGGVLAYWSMTKSEDHTEQTYEYAYSGINTTGILVDDDGVEIIRISTWTGDTSSLYTTWGTAGQYAPTPTQSAQWLQYVIKIYADPGTTITLEQVSLIIMPGQIIIDESGFDPAKYHTSAFMMYNGQRIHSTLSNLSVTTGSSGYAEMILVVLTDQWHRHVEIDGDWTCTNAST